MFFAAAACFVISSLGPPHPHSLKAKSTNTAPVLQDKTFKVQSRPFDLNGLNLQYQYVVKREADNPRPGKVWVMSKKLVDIKRHVVLINFRILSDDVRPYIDLTRIDKEKFVAQDFSDVNFDGYKDVREWCEPCSGTSGQYEDIYLFNHRTKKFNRWLSVLGVNTMLNEKDKTVESYTKGGGDGQFSYQEIKFASHGRELYEKDVDSRFLNEKKRIFKITYEKHVGKKLAARKTRIITSLHNPDSASIIEDMKK